MYSIEYVESEKIWRSPELDPENLCLGAAILEKLKRSDPEKVYEVHHDSGTQVKVKELRSQIITVAQNLLNLGVKKDDHVVFFTMLNVKITPLTFACYTIGTPVCFFETYLEDEHVPGYLEMLDPTVIIFEEKFKPMVSKGLEKLNLSNLKHVFSIDGNQNSVDDLLSKPIVDIESFQAPDIGDPKAQPAILGFTSGSTDLPKIIINSHEMMREAVVGRWQAEPDSVIMVLSEIRWLCQVAAMMQPAFLNVKRVYSSIPPLELTGELIRQIVDTHKVTHYFDVPKIFISLLEAAERAQDPLSLSSLKLVLLGGESMGSKLDSFAKQIVPNCEVGRCYGMTEVGSGMVSSQLAKKKNVNGGVLRKGCRVKIIDSNKNSLGPNEIGRVCLKMTAPFLGYLKNKKANEETFIEGGWIDTGDLGMFDSDNLLHIFTRAKYVLRYSNGKILMPGEVENIVNKFESVHSSVLIGNPSVENPNEDCGTIFVCLQSNIDSVNFENNFKDYLKKELTKEQLLIVKYFKVIEDIPKTTCLKVNRILLKGMCEGGCSI